MMRLCYKLNQKSHKGFIKLNNFYTHYLDKNIKYIMSIYKIKKHTKKYNNLSKSLI